MYKLCGKCEWRTDKCKNPNNVNYDDFRDYFDVCINTKMPYEQREVKNYKREFKHYLKHPDEE
jgi:hypothetical protein